MSGNGVPVRAKILVGGHVQGVGYRAFACRAAEFDKLSKGQASALSEAEAKQRAQLRLQEIAAIAGTQGNGSPLLNVTDVKQLIERFHARG